RRDSIRTAPGAVGGRAPAPGPRLYAGRRTNSGPFPVAGGGGGRRLAGMSDVTRLIDAAAAGDRRAAADLLPLGYDELRELAAARVVELHQFAGLSVEDAAAALGLSRATAYRHWTYARAWLRDALDGPE